MKNLLIIYPHWLPSNLVGVQRARLIANYLPEFGYNVHLLAVDPLFYTEPIVPELTKLAKDHVHVHFVPSHNIFKSGKVIGDLTLRAFFNIRKRAEELIRSEQINFVWLPIPSYYNALLGRSLQRKTGVKFGIDYIDPWVDGFPGQEDVFSKAWVANRLAKFLEPIAVKKSSLISGVAFEYYKPVLDRNFKSKNSDGYTINHCAMQYGFDPYDYTLECDNQTDLWRNEVGIKPILYAGALLPKSHLFIDLLFKSIAKLRAEGNLDLAIRFYFVGTSSYKEKGLLEYAKDNGIEDIIIEKRERISYLQVISLLKQAFGVLVIGSTEKHYTASKVFQSILSGSEIFAIFHQESEAAQILKEANASHYLVKYSEEEDKSVLSDAIYQSLNNFLNNRGLWAPNMEALEPYSARNSARVLAEGIGQCLNS